MHRPVLLALALSLALVVPASAETLELGDPVVMHAAAVAEVANGFVGSTATITITSATNGSGRVFLDTFPLTALDMQGSARLAARTAAQLSGIDVHDHDFFFVVRSSSEQIGGPSAGASMTVGAIAALNGWKVRDDVVMTGTIDPDGTVGPVGGIAEKATAAAHNGAARFLFPAGQDIVPLGPSRTVNLTQYCQTDLKIECIPVVDIVDAVALMTDHAFDRPAVNGNVTGSEFLARLGPLSEELVTAARALHAEANATLAALNDSAAKSNLMERHAAAGQLLLKAANATANETYYTAASVSFQSSIESHYVREAAQYIGATDHGAALASSLAEASRVVERVDREVAASPVTDTNSFEAVGAAQVRIMEAQQRLLFAHNLSVNARSPEELFDAIYWAAFAEERAQTAQWWLKLSEGFPKGEPVETDALEELARDIVLTSTQEVAYIEAVFAGAGANTPLTESRDLLETAERAMTRGFFPAAMLSALEASVRGSVLLELAGYGGIVPEKKFESARENAGRAIQGARARGVESLLAQSAYEFGLSLDRPNDRLVFLGVARVTGNLAGLPGLFDTAPGHSARFQVNPPALRVDIVYVAAAFAVGLALGVGAGLTALMPKRPEEIGPIPTSEPAEPVWNVPPRAHVPETNDRP